MIKHALALSAATFLFIGCSSKAPDPVRLDGGSDITINQNLLLRQDKSVPQDPFLKSNNWTYNIHAQKDTDGSLLKNEQVVKVFLLAHNASKIILVGSNQIAREYEAYFRANGVTAPIEIQPVSSINLQKNLVNILFFHKADTKDQI
ncbi:Cag12 family protein (plasmid) [Campylobacter fetus subsp. venerealis cfvi03/293]|uniref:cag pathogenicity island Cag12 family protein n=1 Tax=Campylobacter fetus TaxID=196 RepID=UPI0003D8AABA|nr:cag pathogenicity island Cag12 family protein [Campylobacter fetus]AHE95274.1 Cag12 family protein [Campylobacter fetus subsp. venerealis cfvi03/293]